MLFNLFFFANLYPYSLILFMFLLIQIFCWFLFPNGVFFRRQWIMIHSVIFISFIVLNQNVTYCLDLFLWWLRNHLLLVMDVDCLLQWLHTLNINSSFGEHGRISPLRPIRHMLTDHILFNINNLTRIGLYHLVDIPGHRLFLLISPLYLWIPFELNSAASLHFQFDGRHHCFLEPLRAVHHYVGAYRRS